MSAGPRASTGDLELAAAWLDAYDRDPSGDFDDVADAMTRAAAWLRAEVERRETDRAVRAIAAAHNVSTSVARSALRRHLAQQTPPTPTT